MSQAVRQLLSRHPSSTDPFARLEADERALLILLRLVAAVGATLAILALSAQLLG
jgi:hypothetical protein